MHEVYLCEATRCTPVRVIILSSVVLGKGQSQSCQSNHILDEPEELPLKRKPALNPFVQLILLQRQRLTKLNSRPIAATLNSQGLPWEPAVCPVLT